MTDKEIIQALRTCVMDPDDGGDCENCPASRSEGEYCLTAVMSEAASLIEQLRREIEWKDSVIDCAQKKRAEAAAERDALIEQIKERHDCIDCKHDDYCEFDNVNLIDCMNCEQDVKGNCYCKDCERGSKWEWQGLAEAPEGGEKA